MKLNFAIWIKFLNSQGIQNKDIAIRLNSSDETISRIKNNRRNMIKINQEDFYNIFFLKDSYLTSEQGISDLYSFFESQDCVSEYIQNKFEEYKEEYKKENQTNPSASKNFLMSVLHRTQYDANKADTHNNFTDPTQKLSINFNKFKNPIIRNKFFGRKTMLENIRKTLIEEGTCIICGIGGLGKSYCSLKYAIDYEKQYSQIQQVIFSTDIKNTLLKIPFDGLDESHLNETEKLEKRFSILESFSEDSLLIIDNMDTIPNDKENYQRLKKLPLHTIFTTRETQLDSPKFQICIDALSENEQLDLFKFYGGFTIYDDELPEYKKLFSMVEGHTLLLELIAKTMAAESLTPSEMIEKLSSHEDNDMSEIFFEKDDQHKQEKMNGFVSKLFATNQLSEPQKEILMNLSLVSIRGIRKKLFKKLLNCQINYINMLINQSWIVQESPGNAESFKIHLHPVIRSAIISNTKPTIETCILFLNNLIQISKEEDIDINEDDKTDLCEIIINANDMFIFNDKHLNLLSDMANILWNHFYYSDTYKIYEKEINILSSSKEPDNELLTDCYENAGKLSVRLAKYENAVENYKKAISLCKENPRKLASLYEKLANVMRKSSNYNEALDFFSKAQHIIDVHRINDPLLESDIYNDMGVTYINLDILDKALENYQKGRQLRESIKNSDEKLKEKIAYSYHNIGTVYQRKKDFSNAIKWHKGALEMRKEIYHKNEPIIASSLTMIGNDYTEAAHNDPNYHYSDAEQYFFEGLKIRKTILGNIHPDTAWSHQSIGKWYFYQGEYEKAFDHYSMCLEIRKIFLQPNHAYIAEILYALGEVNYKLNHIDQANDCLNQALKIQNKLKKFLAAEKTQNLLDKINNESM